MAPQLDLTAAEWGMLRHLITKGFGLLIEETDHLEDVRLKAAVADEITTAETLMVKIRRITPREKQSAQV